MSFFSWLEHRTRQIDSLLCIGLDPHIADLPEPTAEAAYNYCLRLIKATAHLAAAFKPNAAFFEVLGSAGWEVLQRLIEAIPPDIPVILDAKRGDIASTAEAYAQAAFKTLVAHAITLNPYLGRDSIEPFLRDPERGAFLLCKTSNPGAGDLQDLSLIDGHFLYEEVARLAQSWNTRDNLGLVAGATHPGDIRRIRQFAPDLWILAPGIGTQGGDLRTTIRAGLRTDGLGLLIPVSRAVARANDVGQAAEKLRAEINHIRAELSVLPEKKPAVLVPELSRLANGLLQAGCVRFGEFKLKSGVLSPIYLDLRLLVGNSALLWQVAQAYLPILRELAFDHLAAIPYAALPIGTAITLSGGWSLVYPRKEIKEYGTRVEVEGAFNPGERVVVIDDLATTGGSKFEAIERLKSAGLQVQDIVVLIDRQSGASEALANAGYRLHAVFTLATLVEYWHSKGMISLEQAKAVYQFIQG